ncbi:MAG: sigma-54 dependent transcriptional regulator [Fuerstiella sp.]
MPISSKDQPDLSSIPVKVLVVDDDEGHAQAVAESLARINCDCKVATSGKAGAKMVSQDSWDVVVTDLQMDEVNGLEILRQTKEELPDAEVIVLTGHGSITSAVSAMQHGAYTYLTKPLDITELRSAVEKASARLRLLRRNAELRRSLEERFGFEGVIGNSTQMHRIIETLKNVSPTDSTILVHGENGTGKELVAKAIHHNSPRKNKPFVPLNISALPDSILESELFGHEAGAFTGAAGKRIGKFEHANGGTLFLDEVGEMPMDTQVKLLRVLEERRITRLGANDELDINVRLVAATNANLKEMVANGIFREDLYYRLNVVSIELPPLRERPGDIPLLMDHFLKDLSKRIGRDVEGFSRTARKAMLSYQWPGNIRQLRNTVESMIVTDTDGLLDVDGLPSEIAPLVQEDDGAYDGDAASGADSLIGRPMSEVEKFYIQRALELTDGNREETARLLGIGARTLYRKINEYGLRK